MPSDESFDYLKGVESKLLIYLQMLPNEETRSRFETLYIHYRLLMFRVARRILPNDSDAEDAVHQAFLELIGLMDKVKDSNDKRQPRSWQSLQSGVRGTFCESNGTALRILWMRWQNSALRSGSWSNFPSDWISLLPWRPCPPASAKFCC